MGPRAQRLEAVVAEAAGWLAGLPLREDQKTQSFLRLVDGGLGAMAAERAAAAAFLARWAFTYCARRGPKLAGDIVG